MFRSIKAISLLLMVCMAAATGCAASAPSHSAMTPAYGAPNDLYGGGGRGQSYRADEIQTVAAKDVSGSLRRVKPNNGPGDAAGDTSQRTTERKLIRNAWIDLQVKDKRDFDPTIESLKPGRFGGPKSALHAASIDSGASGFRGQPQDLQEKPPGDSGPR